MCPPPLVLCVCPNRTRDARRRRRRPSPRATDLQRLTDQQIAVRWLRNQEVVDKMGEIVTEAQSSVNIVNFSRSRHAHIVRIRWTSPKEPNHRYPRRFLQIRTPNDPKRFSECGHDFKKRRAGTIYVWWFSSSSSGTGSWAAMIMISRPEGITFSPPLAPPSDHKR